MSLKAKSSRLMPIARKPAWRTVAAWTGVAVSEVEVFFDDFEEMTGVVRNFVRAFFGVGVEFDWFLGFISVILA